MTSSVECISRQISQCEEAFVVKAILVKDILGRREVVVWVLITFCLFATEENRFKMKMGNIFVFRSEQGAKINVKCNRTVVDNFNVKTDELMMMTKSIGNIEATEVIAEYPSIIFWNDGG